MYHVSIYLFIVLFKIHNISTVVGFVAFFEESPMFGTDRFDHGLLRYWIYDSYPQVRGSWAWKIIGKPWENHQKMEIYSLVMSK